MLHIFKAKESVPLTRAAALCFCTALAMAQEVSPSSNALASRQSRAQQEAAQQVSLSADKIIEILEKEPGLLLQVKKLLVQEAFEQGQLVDSKDLSDQAVFRSLREDEKGRILATREIEARGYISLKPTHAEVEQRKQREARPREDINNDLRRLEAKSNGQTTSRNGGERDWEKNRRSRFTRYAHTDLQVWSAPAGADSEPGNCRSRRRENRPETIPGLMGRYSVRGRRTGNSTRRGPGGVGLALPSPLIKTRIGAATVCEEPPRVPGRAEP